MAGNIADKMTSTSALCKSIPIRDSRMEFPIRDSRMELKILKDDSWNQSISAEHGTAHSQERSTKSIPKSFDNGYKHRTRIRSQHS